MGFIYRRRVAIGKGTWLNVTRRGVSMSKRMGPVTLNSRGTVRIRGAKGLSWRSR